MSASNVVSSALAVESASSFKRLQKEQNSKAGYVFLFVKESQQLTRTF
jgi:hypothetical protein